MEDFTLEISSRSRTGRAEANRVRKAGFIPGVVYAAEEESIPVKVGIKSFVNLASKATSAQLFTFKSDSKDLDGRIAIVKEIQKDHLRGEPRHIDFLALREDRRISVEVPLKFTGEAPGVKNDGGVLTISAHRLEINCLPRDIPKVVEVDISELALGQNMHASDLKLPEGIGLSGSPEETIVSVVQSKTAALISEAEEALAVAEGEGEGEALEGEAEGEKSEEEKDKGQDTDSHAPEAEKKADKKKE